MMMKIKDGFVIRKVAGEYVCVPVGEMGTEFHGMIQLNDTGAFLWELCTKETTKEEVLRQIIEKYEIDEACAKADLERFLEKLRSADILEENE